MLKNALFLKKLEKSPQLWGLHLYTPKLLLSLNLRVTFEHCSDFSASLKLRHIISYLSNGWGPLVKLAPPLAQTSSYAIKHKANSIAIFRHNIYFHQYSSPAFLSISLRFVDRQKYPAQPISCLDDPV